MRHSIVTLAAAVSFGGFAAILPGCAAGSGETPVLATGSSAASVETPRRSASPIVAYVDGRPIRQDALWPALVEAAGDTVLGEIVLDELLRRRLTERGITLSASEIADELTALSAALSDDPDEAARLLAELRQLRRLGDDRFDRLLRRNAALRKLVVDDVVVTDLQIRKAYERRYGPRYRVRLLTADTAPAAQRLRDRALAGEPFGELAANHSTDPSAAQGGLLSPISAEDPTYPQAVRAALPNLDPATDAGLSPILALDGGFAVLKLEEVLEPEPVDFETEREVLTQAVRRQNERLLMEQEARALRESADVLILEPGLK